MSPNYTMKAIFAFLFAMTFLPGCKKAIQNLQEDAVIQALTNGQWKITNFVHNGNNITSDFSSYKFQYYSDKTVDAIKNDIVEKKGTWDGDASTMTTSANFAGAVAPLSLVNGSWKILNSSWTYVVASQTNGNEIKTMRLDKL